MKKIIFTLLIGFFFSKAYAGPSMRRCMLLPVQDSVQGAIGFKVFEEVERYLKESEWCYYKTNSEILNILGNYKRNLEVHMENKDVLRILAEKTKAGSLIKVKVKSNVKGVDVEVRVIGDNGEDVYFKENTSLNRSDPVLVGQTVNNWLDLYSKRIPYDGRIVGVLGEQFTVDIGKTYGVFSGTEIEIKRPLRKKRHPLLKEVVDWDVEKLADGRILQPSRAQSHGRIVRYFSNKKIEINDWVLLLSKKKKTVVVEKGDFEELDDKKNEYKFGKIGKVGIFAVVGSASHSQSGSASKKLSGSNFGMNLKAELWATRKWWGSLDIGKKFGSLSQEEGTFSKDTFDIDMNSLKLKLGYKYLPMGFFYGPQIDGYFGYASYSYGLDTSSSDNITEVSFKGPLLGTNASMPVMKNFRAYLQLDFILSTGFDESTELHTSEEESASNFSVGFGGIYTYSPSMNIEGGLIITNNKVKFVDESEVKIKDSSLQIGATFIY